MQGEQDNNQAGESAVAGLYANTAGRGVVGQKNPGGLGFGGLFLNDLGYSGALVPVSDGRLKKNIESISGKWALEKLMQLRGTTYQFKDEYQAYLGGNDVFYGFISQEVEQVFPDFVKTKSFRPAKSRALSFPDVGDALDNVKGLCITNFFPILVEAIKEQQKMIEELNKKIEALEKK